MRKDLSDADNNYALHTFQTGSRPFFGVELILENTFENFTKISSHPDGSFNDTLDTITRNAISDISIIMAYSLLEGYFFEECNYHLKKAAKSPIDAINDLSAFHNITLSNWEKRSAVIDIVRKLRNGVAHQNGMPSQQIDKKQCEELFGEDIFQGRKYPRMSPALSINLVRDFRKIVDEYSESVIFDRTK